MSFLGLPVPLLTGALSAGSSLLGGMMTSSAQRAAQRQQQMNFDTQMGVAASQFDQQMGMSREQQGYERDWANRQFGFLQQNAAADRAAQEQFAQMGVQWRANDARRAGLHPLAALGAQLASSSPVSVGGVPSGGVSIPGGSAMPGAPDIRPASGVGDALSSQNMSRAIETMMSSAEKDTAYASAMQALNLDKARMENMLLQKQLGGGRRAVGRSSGFPTVTGRDTVIRGQGDAPSNPRKAAAEMYEDPRVKVSQGVSTYNIGGVEAGIAPANKFWRTGYNGDYLLVGPTKDSGEAFESAPVTALANEFINRALSAPRAPAGYVPAGGPIGGIYRRDYEGYGKDYPDRGFHVGRQQTSRRTWTARPYSHWVRDRR